MFDVPTYGVFSYDCQLVIIYMHSVNYQNIIPRSARESLCMCSLHTFLISSLNIITVLSQKYVISFYTTTAEKETD